MISNTSCAELKLVDKAGLHSIEYHQKFQFSNPAAAKNNNNNNNDISNNKNMNSASTGFQIKSTKPFTFYTSGDGTTPATEPPTMIIIQRSSAEEIANKSPVQSSECLHYEPCTYYNSKQENELTKKIFNNIRNDSALNGVVVADGSGAKVKTSGDTSNSCSNSSNSSSGSSKSDGQKSPMCRTEDQESAFRRIEDVHNYSKLNRYSHCNGRSSQSANVYSSNSSNQDEDEDDEEDEDDGEEEEEEDDDEENIEDYEQHLHATVRSLSAIGRQIEKGSQSVGVGQELIQPQKNLKSPQIEQKLEIKCEDEGNKSPPDHHARRPMNAFLIFCKRHRGIVKERYKNFENRSITKILGEWWASLDPNDKKPYVTLAKQNKDAFFSANPNFKWYKLPAPSLRTLNTRPGNIERPYPNSNEYQYDINDSSLQNTSSHTLSPNAMYGRCDTKKVSYFKLADETQMGELNSLMRPMPTPSTSDALQEALGETSVYFKSGCKRKSSTGVEDPVKTKRAHLENSFSSSEDDLMPKKSTRSCKGKKYQELMNSGQIKQLSPKPYKAVSSNNINPQLVHPGDFSKVTSTNKEEPISPKQNAQSKDIEGQYMLPDSPDSYGSTIKQQFSFVPFDLEDKIRALPAQCLDTYLQRKKNTKRKKKINSKKRPLPQAKTETLPSQGIPRPQPKTAQEAKEQVVGSQKRKARKESITRRDINSIQNEVQVLLNSGSMNPVIVGGGSVSAVSQAAGPANNNATSDLLILAEVAANHTGIAQ